MSVSYEDLCPICFGSFQEGRPTLSHRPEVCRLAAAAIEALEASAVTRLDEHKFKSAGYDVKDAAVNGRLEIVHELLVNGAVSIVDRSQAIVSAIQAGPYRIASELLPAKAILMPAVLGLAASYINCLQYQEKK